MKELSPKSQELGTPFSFTLSFGDHLNNTPKNSTCHKEIADQIQISKENENPNFSKIPVSLKLSKELNVPGKENSNENDKNNQERNIGEFKKVSNISIKTHEILNKNLIINHNLHNVEMMPLKQKNMLTMPSLNKVKESNQLIHSEERIRITNNNYPIYSDNKSSNIFSPLDCKEFTPKVSKKNYESNQNELKESIKLNDIFSNNTLNDNLLDLANVQSSISSPINSSRKIGVNQRFIILGEKSVGKTTLIFNLLSCSQSYSCIQDIQYSGIYEYYGEVIFVEFNIHNRNLFDYFEKEIIIIIVYSTDKRSTFLSATSFIENNIESLLNMNSRIILLANQKDKDDNVSKSMGINYSRKFDFGFIQCNLILSP